jgi:acyl dehydratase
MTHISAPPPYFEDFEIDDEFGAPGITLTTGHAALYQAITGDRMILPLDHALATKVTGSPTPPVHPMLVINAAIGQSTHVSQRVKANLFYRGLVMREPVGLGDTLRTTTRVKALRQNRPRPDRPATGLVVLKMDVRNQHDQEVLSFYRCPMIPCRDPAVVTGRSDAIDGFGEDVDISVVAAGAPRDWQQAMFEDSISSPLGGSPTNGAWFEAPARETVTLAPELVRMTLNLAMAHTDSGESYLGRRLVYGGHVISLACAQVSRAMPGMATILAWEYCDHTAPVIEGDVLSSRMRITDSKDHEQWRICRIEVETTAHREADMADKLPTDKVLEWCFYALIA